MGFDTPFETKSRADSFHMKKHKALITVTILGALGALVWAEYVAIRNQYAPRFESLRETL